MARKKKEEINVEEAMEEAVAALDPKSEQKERLAYLEDLYEVLKEEGIRSVSDLENKIALAQKEI